MSVHLLLLSCKGQEGPTQAKDKPTTEDSEIGTWPNQTREWIDPLFEFDGQLCQHLRQIHQDKNDNLWFGTNNYGIMRYDGEAFSYFTNDQGVQTGRTTEILEDQQGNLWFATYSGLIKYDGEAFTTYDKNDGLTDSELWSCILASDGTFWIGTVKGVNRFDGETFTSFPVPKVAVQDTTTVLDYDRINTIEEDKDGNIWIATDGFGIWKYDGEDLTHLSTDNGLIDNNITGLMLDSKGNMWMGSLFHGVSMYDGETFHHFTEQGDIKGVEAGAFYEDAKGNIWFAAEHEGIYRYDGKNFAHYGKKEGLPTGGVLTMLEDRQGRFWIGGWLGLFRWEGDTFIPVTKDGPWQ